MTTLETLRSVCPAPSVGVLTADLLALGAELALLERAGVGVVHVDVMDGCFTPMMTVGPAFVKALKTPLLKDVHLMIREPLDKIAEYVAAGADIVTVHQESTVHVHRVLQALGAARNANDPARGIVRGLALNPGTPLSALEPLLPETDMVVLLAVNPGWGGRSSSPRPSAGCGRCATWRPPPAGTSSCAWMAGSRATTPRRLPRPERTCSSPGVRCSTAGAPRPTPGSCSTPSGALRAPRSR